MKTKKTLLLSILCLCLLILLTSCGKSSIEGRWEPVDKVENCYPDTYIEFFKDGSFEGDGHAGTYTAENGRLHVVSGLQSYTYDYELSGDTLIITYENRDPATYKKQ